MSFVTETATDSPAAFFLPEYVFPAVLPDDIAILKSLLRLQNSALLAQGNALQAQQIGHEAAVNIAVEAAVVTVRREAQEQITRMIEQLVLARHRQFGVSSEQLAGQARLFDEVEALAQSTSAADDIAPILPEAVADDAQGKKPAKAARGKRSALPAASPRIDVINDVPEHQRSRPCGTPMVEIGQDVSEQLDIVPMHLRVLRYIRKHYGCCASVHAPITAALPPQPLPKSNASADFIAMLLGVKFIDGLPLARFEYVLDRHGMPVPRQTLARWVISEARLLQPLHNLLRDTLFDSAFLHMDETVVQVLKEDGKAPMSTSYMWVQTGGPPGRPVVLYDYDQSRSSAVPVRLLEGYQGYLMTDGYDGYNALIRAGGIRHMACWAHARRRFVDAVRVQPKGVRGRADEAVSLIGTLYAIERTHKVATDSVRLLARQQHSVPALAALHDWLQRTLPGVTPKSALGTALAILQKYWQGLTRYTELADLPIDNNRCENAIRPFVLGRKAWLFSDTPAGAHSSAVIYSLLQTAKANGVEPYLCLRHVLRKLPAAQTVDEVEALWPWNVTPELAAFQ